MSTRRYQILGDIVTGAQLDKKLEGYMPVDDNAEIVEWVEVDKDNNLVVSMKDGRESKYKLSGSKDFANVEYDGSTGYLHFYDNNGNDVYDPVFIGGGTGTGQGTEVRLTNQNGTTALVGSYGSAITLMFTFTSLEDDLETGNGTCKIIVNGVTKHTTSIPQGLNAIDVAPYLAVGSNTVKVTCIDTYGISKSLTYEVTVIKLTVESTFNAAVTYNGDITFKYTPYGAVEKTVHFLVDDNNAGTVVTSLTGKQLTKTFTKMSHGVHRLEVYSTATVNDTEIKSPSLLYDIICIEDGDRTPIIASVYETEELEQGAMVSIPYIVYDPTKLACDVTLTIYTLSSGSEVVYNTQTITVDRSQQTWTTRKYPVGTVYFRVAYGDIDKTHTVTVIESSIKVEPETNDLELQLTSEGRSNNETNPGEWKYGDISTTFSNFNWSSTGWVNDENGDACLRLNGDARAEISFQPFSSDLRTYGKTIELEFAIRDVHNRSAVPISCISGGIGFEVKPDTTYFKSEQSEVFCNYKDDERVKVTFVLESKDEHRLLSIYLNGVRSDAVQYPTTDNFQQTTPVNISIGSSDCGVDIYTIRSYSTALTSEGVKNNFIADITDIVRKTEAYEDNDIYDDFGEVDYLKAREKNSVMVIIGDLPASKGDKKKVRIEYYDVEDSTLDFDENDVTIDVQGTSSQFFVRKNWKLKFAKDHYIDFDQLPAKVICIKVDYAEATGTHNTQNANFVERLYTEKTPAQLVDPKCRSTIYGKPILLFHQADSTSDPVFYGKSNFNYDKGAEYVFGFTDDFDVECWEFKNNTSDACNFLGPVPEIWVDDFEARYPEETTAIERFKEMHDWVVSTKGNLEKFKMEFEDHFDMHFSLIYYVYTFFALMVDQRAKNMFLTYWGETGKWQPWFYDNDTSYGINNEGQLVLSYWHEDTDLLAGANVYNGQNSVLWCNFRDAFPDEIKATYQDLRSNGVLNYDELIDQFITKGSDKWSESIYNEDADFKYISMLETDGDASNLEQVRGTGEEHFRYFVENRLNYCDSKWYASAYADDYVAVRIYTPNTWAGVEPNANITVTPYSHMYAGVRYKANGTLYQKRVDSGIPVTFSPQGETFESENNETFNDTETGIYGASQLSSLGDLSPLYCGSLNVSKATKLTELIIGSNAEGYSNPNLKTLSVGTNNLLKVLNVRNCPKLSVPLALSGCPNIEEIYAAGSGITAVELAKSGYLKIIELPATIANLTLTNQLYIESLTLEGYDAIKTINIENCPTVASLDILGAATNVERVRLTNVDWSYDTAAEVLALADRNLAGIDENGLNTDKMWIDGKCHIKALSGAEYLKVKEAFPYLTITYDSLTAILTYKSEDGNTKLYEETIINGGDGDIEVSENYDNLINLDVLSESGKGGLPDGTEVDGVVKSITPFIAVSPNTTYKFNLHEYIADGHQSYELKLSTFDSNHTHIRTHTYAMYNATSFTTTENVYYVKILFFTGHPKPYFGLSGNVIEGIAKPTKATTAQYTYTFGGWSLTPGGEPDPNALKNVEADRIVYAAFNKELRKYTVKFYNGTTLLQTVTDVPYGSDATYTGSTPVNNSTGNPADFEFYGWSPAPTNIQGDTNCYAQFHDLREITDSWATIAANVANGTATSKYAVGAFKTLNIGEKELPYEFNQGSAVVYDGEIHILGSVISEYRTSHYKWDGTEWVEVGVIPYEFYYGSAVVYNNEIHILGGSSSSSGRTKHYKWDGSNWTFVSTLPYVFEKGVAIVYDNEIHIMGSYNSSNYTSHYKWNGSAWSEVGNLPYSFYTASGFIYNNEIHVLGSYDSSYETAHYKYDGSSWTSVSTLPQKLSNGHALVVGTDIYMIQWDELYKYDGVSWHACPEVPANVYDGRSVVLDDDIYVMGSSVSGNGRVFYSYAPETETWSKVGITESIPMQVIAHNHDELPDGVGKWEGIAKPTNIPQYGCAVTYQNEVHALGGNSSFSYTQHIKWDTTNSAWVTVSTLPYQFRSGCALVLNDEIHILGSYQTTNKTEHYKWNATDGWVSVSTLPYSFYCSSAVVLNNEIHILGSYYSSSRKYHYKWDGTEWTSVSTLPYNFYYGSAVVYNGEIHIFSGSGSSAGHYKWDGSAWTSVSTLPYSLQYGVATIINNEIHIFGGSDNPTGHYKWNGTEWISMTTLPGNFENYPLAVCNGTPYIFISTSCYKLAGPSWEQVNISGGNFNYTNIFSTKIGDVAYILSNRKIYKFDGLDMNFTHVVDCPTSTQDRGFTSYKGDLYIFANMTNSETSEKYNALLKFTNNEWIEIQIPTFNTDAMNAVLIEYKDKLHMIYGEDHYTYDGNEFVLLNKITDSKFKPFRGKAVIFDDCIYYGNGYYNDKLIKYDGETYTVAYENLSYSANISLCIYNGALYKLHDKELSKFNTLTNEFESCTSLAVIVRDGLLVALKGKLYAGLGASLSNRMFVLTNPRATLTFLAGNLLKDKKQYHASNNQIWSASDLRAFCNGDLFNTLPEDLQSTIREIIKMSDTGCAGQSLEKINDKVWICSMEELGLSPTNIIKGQGDAYSVFTDNESRKRFFVDGENASSYWTRSSNIKAAAQVNIIGIHGQNGGGANANTNQAVLFGFCI